MTRSSRLISETKWFRFLSRKFLEIFVWRTTEHKYSIWLMERETQVWHFVDGQWNTNMAFGWALLSPLSPSTDTLLGFHVHVPISFCFQNWLRWLLSFFRVTKNSLIKMVLWTNTKSKQYYFTCVKFLLPFKSIAILIQELTLRWY